MHQHHRARMNRQRGFGEGDAIGFGAESGFRAGRTVRMPEPAQG